MLGSIYSFYTQNVSPTLSTLWDRIPNLPTEKLPSAKKVALCALGLFCLYKIYRSYQSLLERVTRAEQALQTATSTNTTLAGRVAALEQQLSDLKARPTISLPSSDKTDQDSTTTDDEGYHSFDEEDHLTNSEPVTPSLPPPASPTILTAPKDLFVQNFPGKHIRCTAGSKTDTLANHLLESILRIREVVSVTLNVANDTYTLTYASDRIVTVTKLPQAVWDKMPTAISWAVSPLLKIAPGARMSQIVRVQIVKTAQATQLIFNAEAFSMEPNSLGYTAYLKSITIPAKAGEELHIEAEHNSSVGKKAGPVDPTLLLESIYLNLSVEARE